MDKNEYRLKRIQTDIKSAQGAMAISLVLTLIYIIKAIFSKNLNFYFSFYTVEFLLKDSGFFPEFKGALPKAAVVVGILAFMGLAITFTALSQKKPSFLYGCLVLYGFDTVFMLIGKLSGFFSPLVQEDFIDIIVHAFILTFLIIGVAALIKQKHSDVLTAKAEES